VARDTDINREGVIDEPKTGVEITSGDLKLGVADGDGISGPHAKR
jgi:hypothetical protein